MNPSGDMRLLRAIALGFIWVGGIACIVYLLTSLPSLTSFSGILFAVTDVVGRLSTTVGLGAVLLALADIAESMRKTVEKQTHPPGQSTPR